MPPKAGIICGGGKQAGKRTEAEKRGVSEKTDATKKGGEEKVGRKERIFSFEGRSSFCKCLTQNRGKMSVLLPCGKKKKERTKEEKKGQMMAGQTQAVNARLILLEAWEGVAGSSPRKEGIKKGKKPLFH